MNFSTHEYESWLLNNLQCTNNLLTSSRWQGQIKRRTKSKWTLFHFTLWLWGGNTISSVPKVFHLLPAKANLLFHDVSFPASLNAPFAMAVQERTVMLMAFEVWTYTMITAKSTWWFPFFFSAYKLLKRGALHVSLQTTVQWAFLPRWRP